MSFTEVPELSDKVGKRLGLKNDPTNVQSWSRPTRLTDQIDWRTLYFSGCSSCAPVSDTLLCGWSPEMFLYFIFRFRIVCNKIITHKMFDHIVLIIIFLNCITIAMERPRIDPTSAVSLKHNEILRLWSKQGVNSKTATAETVNYCTLVHSTVLYSIVQYSTTV